MRIAVLALQGAFIEHERMLASLGADVIELRQERDLQNAFDGLVLPGGESTVQGKLLRETGLFEPLRRRIESGLPVFGTCAGLLLLEAGAWCQLMTAPGLLPAACSVYLLSRSLTVVAGSRFPYTPSSTLGILFASRAAKGVAALGTVETALSLLLRLGLGGLFAGWRGLLAAAVAAIGAGLLFWWYRSMTRRQFGGITGDLLGFFVELSQLVMLFLLALVSMFV